MRGAPPPEPPRGGRPGQSGRYPGALGGQGQRGSLGGPPRPSGTGWRAGPGGPSGANWGAPPNGSFAPGGFGPRGQRPALGPGAGQWTSARMAATGMRIPATGMSPAVSKHGHLRFAILHDGNPGHIWRGEFGSMFGESIIATGLVMWLAYLTASPDVVAIALVALGLPFLVAGPLAAPFTRKEEPGGLLRLVGWLRVVLTLGLIGMHYLTILPVVFLLLFGISLCGRLRAALRVAALRGCLAPGEPERVAAATHFAAVVVAVVGPLLASLLFIIAAQRILLLAGVAALVFLLSASSDSLLSALPTARRAFLLARPEPEHDASPDVDDRDDPDDDDAYDDDDRESDPTNDADDPRRREAALPEWQQWGPGTIGQAMADVFGGFRLAGSARLSYGALRILAAIALVGGGLGMLEVFYITDHLLQPTYYLGALVAAEGAGLALGAMLWSDLGRRASGTAAMFLGTIGTGVALGALALATALPMVILLALGLGVANAVAVEGAREALRAGFDGVERRALAAGETAVTAFCGLVGAVLFDLLLRGFAIGGHGIPGGAPRTTLPPLDAAQLILDAGVGLAVAGLLSIFLVAFGGMRARARDRRAAAREERRGRTPGRLPNLEDDEDGDWDDDASREYTAWGESSADSRYAPAADDSRYMTGYTGSTSARWEDDGDWGESSTYDNPRGRGRR